MVHTDVVQQWCRIMARHENVGCVVDYAASERYRLDSRDDIAAFCTHHDMTLVFCLAEVTDTGLQDILNSVLKQKEELEQISQTVKKQSSAMKAMKDAQEKGSFWLQFYGSVSTINALNPLMTID